VQAQRGGQGPVPGVAGRSFEAAVIRLWWAGREIRTPSLSFEIGCAARQRYGPPQSARSTHTEAWSEAPSFQLGMPGNGFCASFVSFARLYMPRRSSPPSFTSGRNASDTNK